MAIPIPTKFLMIVITNKKVRIPTRHTLISTSLREFYYYIAMYYCHDMFNPELFYFIVQTDTRDQDLLHSIFYGSGDDAARLA